MNRRTAEVEHEAALDAFVAARLVERFADGTRGIDRTALATAQTDLQSAEAAYQAAAEESTRLAEELRTAGEQLVAVRVAEGA